MARADRAQPTRGHAYAPNRATTDRALNRPVRNAIDGAGNARKLIDKLAIAGQLGAGFLLRVLLQGQTELFDLAFARLLDLDVENFRTAFYAHDARNRALACRAVGIDRSVFATVQRLAAGGLVALAQDGPSAVDDAFALPKCEALARLQAFF